MTTAKCTGASKIDGAAHAFAHSVVFMYSNAPVELRSSSSTATRDRPRLAATLGSTPIPSLRPGFGALPRFRSDVAFFVGLAASLDARAFEGGFVPGETGTGAVGGVDVSFTPDSGLSA